ncbi:unnamed protein product [Lota lota]
MCTLLTVEKEIPALDLSVGKGRPESEGTGATDQASSAATPPPVERNSASRRSGPYLQCSDARSSPSPTLSSSPDDSDLFLLSYTQSILVMSSSTGHRTVGRLAHVATSTYKPPTRRSSIPPTNQCENQRGLVMVELQTS